MTDYLTAVVTAISDKDRNLGQRINAYFFTSAPGEHVAPGMRVLMARISNIELMANAGTADPSRLYVGKLIVDVVKDKFPPRPQKE